MDAWGAVALDDDRAGRGAVDVDRQRAGRDARLLLHQEIVAPGDDAEAFTVLKRQLDAMVANRGRSPGQIFGEKLALINSSNHYTAQPLTAERVAALDKAKMSAFYKQRFANAADFTFFMVGAFKVDEALPLLARYVGSLPAAGP